jgi:hypothetical protein
VPLVAPPQGGDVLYAAARVRNMDSCSVQVSGQLSDPATGNELAFDSRPADLVAGSDGWGRPPDPIVAYVSNLPLCPDNNTVDIQGRPAKLTVTMKDKAGRVASVSQMVVPTCMQGDPVERNLCVCDCSAIQGMQERTCSD